MGNLTSHEFDYSEFVEVVSNGVKINGLPPRDQKLLDNFFSILQGALINDPVNPELLWGSAKRRWADDKGIQQHFGWVKSYIAVRRSVPIKIAEIYNDQRRTFSQLSILTQKQLAHFYTMIMLIDGVHSGEDLSKLLQRSDFSQYLFHDEEGPDYQKVDHWLKFLSKIKTHEKNKHFVKREEIKEEQEESSKPQTLEEYLDQILFKLDSLHSMYQRLEKRLDDEKSSQAALRKRTQS